MAVGPLSPNIARLGRTATSVLDGIQAGDRHLLPVSRNNGHPISAYMWAYMAQGDWSLFNGNSNFSAFSFFFFLFLLVSWFFYSKDALIDRVLDTAAMPRTRTYVITTAIIAAVVTVILIKQALAFIHLFRQHAGISITQEEVKLAYYNSSSPEQSGRHQYIPKIIHQIYHDWSGKGLPDDWKKLQQTCIDLNPGWEYMVSFCRVCCRIRQSITLYWQEQQLWGTNESTEFVREYYPGFLSTYEGYAFPVQRVDTMKYLLMRYYGGIYIDLDNVRDSVFLLIYCLHNWPETRDVSRTSTHYYTIPPGRPTAPWAPWATTSSAPRGTIRFGNSWPSRCGAMTGTIRSRTSPSATPPASGF